MENLEVILSLVEGHDFGFIGSNFIIEASLDGIKMETGPFPSEQHVNFNSELIWTSTRNNIKKMRNYKVPIKIELFRDGENARKSLGYIILNLKWAQFMPRREQSKIKQVSYKVCGTGKEAKGCHPDIILSFHIQEVEPDEARNSLPFSIKPPLIDPPRLEAHESTRDQKEMTRLNSYTLAVFLKDIQWKIAVNDVHLRFHHTKAEVTWTAHDAIQETHSGLVTCLNSLSAQFKFVETSTDLEKLLNMLPPSMSVCSLKDGRPFVLGVANLNVPSIISEKEIMGCAEVRGISLNEESLGTLCYSACLEDNGPHNIQQLSFADNLDIGERLIDDLEAWKEKEKNKYKLEFEEKLKDERVRLETLWSKKEEELEKDLSDRMEICRSLSEELQKVLDEVKEKEKSMENERLRLETAHKILTEETKNEIFALKKEHTEHLKSKDQIISELQRRLEDLSVEGEKKNQETRCIMMEQMKKLQEKLDSANKSKDFFKQQWSRAVKELHRVKSDGWNEIPVRVNFNEIQRGYMEQLGLHDSPIRSDH